MRFKWIIENKNLDKNTNIKFRINLGRYSRPIKLKSSRWNEKPNKVHSPRSCKNKKVSHLLYLQQILVKPKIGKESIEEWSGKKIEEIKIVIFIV